MMWGHRGLIVTELALGVHVWVDRMVAGTNAWRDWGLLRVLGDSLLGHGPWVAGARETGGVHGIWAELPRIKSRGEEV